MIATLFLVLSTIFGVLPTPPSECNISNIVAEKSACNDSGYYNITLNFQHENTSDSFEIESFGIFAYTDLPITLTHFKGDGTDHGFLIADMLNHDCLNDKFVEGSLCEPFNCDLSEMTLTRSDCDSLNHFYVTLDFEYQGTSDSFYVQGNGHQYGHFAYADLPIVLGPFEGNSNQTFEFAAKDLHNPDCKTSGFIHPPYCSGCSIFDVVAERSLCDSAGYYSITFNFQYQSTSDSFLIAGYGTYAYSDLPVTISGFKGDGENHVFDIFDRSNHNCIATKQVEGRHCAPFNCDLSEMTLTRSDCDSLNHFYVTLDFEYQGTSDSFYVQGNGHQYGHFAYADLPIVLGPFEGNSNQTFEFAAKDLHNPDCKTSGFIHPPYCSGCSIYDVVAERSLCDSAGYYSITFNFQYQSTSDSFLIAGYGTYAYTDLPVTLYGFEGNGVDHTFDINDQGNHNCGTTKRVEGRRCGECHLSGLTLTRSDCNEENQFFVTIDFDHMNTSDSFRIQGNGHQYGIFAYTDLPVILGPFNGNSGQSYEFGITDLNHPNCHIGGQIEPPYCGECYIREISAVKSDCDSTGHYAITFDFEYGETSDSFEISGYGHFAYADLPITLTGFAGNGQGHAFHFTDLHNSACTRVREVPGKMCESEDCLLSNLSVTISNCNEDHYFYVEINFDENEASDSFRIQGNDHQYGRFSYEDLPVSIGPFNGNTDRHYEFVIKDLIFGDCAIDTVISPPYCQSDTNGLLITYISMQEVDCISKDSYVGKLYLGNNLPPDMKVNVWEGNEMLGQALVSDFPKQFTFSMKELPAIKIQDVNNPANVYFLHYAHPDCSPLSTKTNKVEYKLYPNPVSQLLYVEGAIELSVTLKSMNGRVLTKAQGERIELRMSDYKPGLYILEIQSTQGIAIQKVIKM